MTTKVDELYEPHVLKARSRLETDRGLRALLDPTIDPALLERFLIQYCSLGVRMTEPVEGWIRRAGERCIEIGLGDLGRTMLMHARHEAGHHLMMIEDTRYLVRRWNERRAPALDAERLLQQSLLAPTLRYVQLHESVIAGEMPFGQVAIEFEIEALSVRLGPRLMTQFQRVLGDDIVQGLSFIAEHVALDVGHTQLNERMMNRLLDARPGAARALGEVGSAALDTYLDFFNGCFETAAAALRAAPAA